MSKYTDLRVLKTKRAIREAFLQLLQQKALDRISVVELANRAEISKGTFYLHYQDIYHLYNEVLLEHIHSVTSQQPFYAQMLTNPEAFVRNFFSSAKAPADAVEKALFKEENLQYCHNLLQVLIHSAAESVYASVRIPRSRENSAKLHFLIGGLYAQTVFSFPSAASPLPEEAIAYMAGQIRASFPAAFDSAVSSP